MDRLKEIRSDDDEELQEMNSSSDPTPEISKAKAAYVSIQEIVQKLKGNTTKIKALKEREKKSVNENDRKAIMNQVNDLLSESNQLGASAKGQFDSIKSENASATSRSGTTAQIHANLYNQNVKKFQEVMKDFNEASEEYKKCLQERTRRELKHVGIKDEEVERVIESGNANEVLAQAITSENLDDLVLDIQNRHSDILKLEHQVLEVQELFLDLANLVNIQGETIDNIQENITHAVKSTEDAASHVKDAEHYQTKARKQQCLIAIIVIIILIVILAPVLGTTLKSS